MEVESLTEKNQELEKLLGELRSNNEQQVEDSLSQWSHESRLTRKLTVHLLQMSDGGTEGEIQLKQEQQRRREAEKNLQNLKEALETENQQVLTFTTESVLLTFVFH